MISNLKKILNLSLSIRLMKIQNFIYIHNNLFLIVVYINYKYGEHEIGIISFMPDFRGALAQ